MSDVITKKKIQVIKQNWGSGGQVLGMAWFWIILIPDLFPPE